MRLFVAVALPTIFKEALSTFRKDYTSENIRFIPEQNLHLTLHFLGDTPEENLEELVQNLGTVATKHRPFTLIFQETAPGPKLNSPRLIWARFQEHAAYNQLATELCTITGAAPGAFGKFIPHITIARFRKDKPKPDALPVIRSVHFPELPVTSFALWQSELLSPHPVYTILREFPLFSA